LFTAGNQRGGTERSPRTTTQEECEFDEWYTQAMQQDFEFDLPKTTWVKSKGEMQVKVSMFWWLLLIWGGGLAK